MLLLSLLQYYSRATNSAFEMTGCAAYGNSSDPGRERRLTPSVSVAGGIYEDYNN